MENSWLACAEQQLDLRSVVGQEEENSSSALLDQRHAISSRPRGRPKGTFGDSGMREFLKESIPAQDQNRNSKAAESNCKSNEELNQLQMVLSPLGTAFQRQILSFAKTQSEAEDLETDPNDNPGVRWMSSESSGILASVSKTAEQHGVDRVTETRNIRRVAACLSLGGGQLWATFLDGIKSMIESGAYVPVCFSKKRRYDETPLRIRIEEEKNPALPEAPTEAQLGVAGKVLQTEFTLQMLLRNRASGEYIQMEGKAPTWLQVLESTNAECVKQAQLQIENNVGNLQEIARLFPMCFNFPCTDMHPSNICVEKSFQHDNPTWNSFHSYCLVHKVGRCMKSIMSLVEGHASGVLAVGKSLEFAGSTRTLRRHLAELLEERLEVQIGEPSEVTYREAIYELLLGLTTTTRKQHCKPLFKKNSSSFCGVFAMETSKDKLLSAIAAQRGLIDQWFFA